MVSIQPINISYIEADESCFLRPIEKVYEKGGMMNALMIYSPIFAYLAQVAKLDGMLDSYEFNGTCIAPCKEYSDKYFKKINRNVDHGTARKIVLHCCLQNQTRQSDMFDEPKIMPTLNGYTHLKMSINKRIDNKYIVVTGDLQCTNGILHLVNGLMDPEIPS